MSSDQISLHEMGARYLRIKETSLSKNRPLRAFILRILQHPFAEPAVLLLIAIQTLLLALQQQFSVTVALVVINIVYSLEIGAKIAAYGLYTINPQCKHLPFLRHSFNRLDFVAVSSFWLSLCLQNVDSQYVRVLHLLACLRVFRLLLVPRGSSIILKSLKTAAPLLLNVAFFVAFFWLLFAIIGVQSFKSSLRRQCVWQAQSPTQSNYTQQFQFCGGHINPKTLLPESFYLSDGSLAPYSPKGYICPVGLLCIQDQNPYNNSLSYDNIWHSMELVAVIMSFNTFTDLLYYTIDSDYYFSCFFFIGAGMVLSFWLLNLVIAVVTTSFGVIREESKASAFSSKNIAPPCSPPCLTRKNTAQHVYKNSEIIWLALIAVDMTFQSLRQPSMGASSEHLLDLAELIITAIFAFEIILRFSIHFPNWRYFFKSFKNLFDLFLVITTCIIQIPVIHNAKTLYSWLTIFQILRIYRLIMAVTISRRLLQTVLGNWQGLVNLIFFLVFITFVVALLAAQFMKGIIPESATPINFRSLFNSFLAMYQILSSENWTVILYNSTSFLDSTTRWIPAVFFIIWFFFANTILLSMFIAVIQENFEVPEEEKRRHQVRTYIEKTVPLLTTCSDQTNMSFAALLKRFKKTTNEETEITALNMLMKEAVVHDFLDERSRSQDREEQTEEKEQLPLYTRLLRKLGLLKASNPPVRLVDQRTMNPTTAAHDAIYAHAKLQADQTAYLSSYPNFDRALYCLSTHNPLRLFCQKLVAPSFGRRKSGCQPRADLWYVISALTYASIVAVVLIACITTPLYQRQYIALHGSLKNAWFLWADVAFAAFFTFEAVVKIIADGFYSTPNAYFKNLWNKIDLFVLVSLWINVVAEFSGLGALGRASRAFKALRALRLVNISSTARDTFHHVVISGFWNILGAAVVSISLLVPFAIWGLNIFNGTMYSCNDSSDAVANITQCVNEYISTPFQWDIWAPRAWDNVAYWSFDTFGRSLLLLFEIVSQEGWVDVMEAAMAITGRDQSPQSYSSPGNALFFVTFNLLGSVFVLVLNYTEKSGGAFLTSEQRSWRELKKILLQMHPSRRPAEPSSTSWKAWCYDRAVSKKGCWSRFITAVYLIHIILLMADFYPTSYMYDKIKDLAFLFLVVIYLLNITIRITGLGYRNYLSSLWNIFDCITIFGTAVTTSVTFFDPHQGTLSQFQKLFLVVLNLIPKIDSLDQLFKTAAASLPAIANLLLTWLVFYVMYAIAFNQIFGLTRMGQYSRGKVNFRTMRNALVLLFRMSAGEGWNAIMHDFTVEEPYCVGSSNFFMSDCGSAAWAFTLFISWNIISMYIFVNMLVTVVYDSFSYVYQKTGKLSTVTRTELRGFKECWRKFDQNGTGFIQAVDAGHFLGTLRGAFDVRVYDEEFSVPRLVQDCKTFQQSFANQPKLYDFEDIDLQFLYERLSLINRKNSRQRRQTFSMIFWEAQMLASEDPRGISFNKMLILLSHWKIVDDNRSLALDEFLKRRARLQQVEELVSTSLISGFFQTLYQSRAYRARHSPHTQVPQIILNDHSSGQTSLPRLDLSCIPTFEEAENLSRASSDNAEVTVSRWSTIGRSKSSPVGERLSPDGLSENDRDSAHRILDSFEDSPWADALQRRSSPSAVEMSQSYSYHSSASDGALSPRRPSA